MHEKNNTRSTLYHFILTLLNTNSYFEVNMVNEVAKCALPGKVMQGSPCPELRTLINENWRYVMKLNDKS